MQTMDDFESQSAGLSNIDDRALTRIQLPDMNPTRMRVIDYSKLALEDSLPVKRGGLVSLVIVATKQGKVQIYKVDGKDQRHLLTTKGGMSFGAITGLSVQDGGHQFIVGTETGELMSYKLYDHLNQPGFIQI